MNTALLHVGSWADGQLHNTQGTTANTPARTHQTGVAMQTNIDSSDRIGHGQEATNMLERFIQEPAVASGCVETFMGGHDKHDN